MRGRRVSYLNPIKMYVFTSAFFFVFFFSVFKSDKIVRFDTKDAYSQVIKNINDKKGALEEIAKDPKTSAASINLIRDDIGLLNDDLVRLEKDTTNLQSLNYYNIEFFYISSGNYNTADEYEAAQQKLAPDQRDGRFEHQYRKKKLLISEEYGGKKTFKEVLLDKYMHSFPQILFVSLPVYALLLQLVYVRRKSFYYADHIIYTVHLYCALFIMIFLRMVIGRAKGIPYIGWLSVLTTPITLYVIWYIYKSMRTFYEQSRVKTILKYILIVLFSSVMMTFLFGVFFILSLFTV
jgi:hypothetical protein